MSTAQTFDLTSTSPEQTERFAEAIGSKLRGGEVIELVSDLGGGKTTFTRGLAHGAGSKDRVASPTFTISKEYTAPTFTIAHFDFYRLGEAGIVGDEIEEILGDSTYVTVIEWAGVVSDVLPEKRFIITITQMGEDARHFSCTFPEELAYLLEDIR